MVGETEGAKQNANLFFKVIETETAVQLDNETQSAETLNFKISYDWGEDGRRSKFWMIAGQ